jgi:hypothetical protein
MGFLFVTNNDQSAISNLLHTTLHRHRQQTDITNSAETYRLESFKRNGYTNSVAKMNSLNKSLNGVYLAKTPRRDLCYYS